MSTTYMQTQTSSGKTLFMIYVKDMNEPVSVDQVMDTIIL